MKFGLWVSLLVSLMLPATAFGQGSAVSGQVRDNTGGIFPDVKVTISGSALETPLTTLTAEKGKYQFENLPAGLYQVVFDPSMSASCPTFSKVKRNITVVSGFVTKVDASLPIGAHQVTVVATPDNDLVQVTTSLAAEGSALAINLEP